MEGKYFLSPPHMRIGCARLPSCISMASNLKRGSRQIIFIRLFLILLCQIITGMNCDESHPLHISLRYNFILSLLCESKKYKFRTQAGKSSLHNKEETKYLESLFKTTTTTKHLNPF